MDLSTIISGWRFPIRWWRERDRSPMTSTASRRLEDAGAAAIVLRSLFEEQITREQMSEFDEYRQPLRTRSPKPPATFPAPTPSRWARSST